MHQLLNFSPVDLITDRPHLVQAEAPTTVRHVSDLRDPHSLLHRLSLVDLLTSTRVAPSARSSSLDRTHGPRNKRLHSLQLRTLGQPPNNNSHSLTHGVRHNQLQHRASIMLTHGQRHRRLLHLPHLPLPPIRRRPIAHLLQRSTRSTPGTQLRAQLPTTQVAVQRTTLTHGLPQPTAIRRNTLTHGPPQPTATRRITTLGPPQLTATMGRSTRTLSIRHPCLNSACTTWPPTLKPSSRPR